MSIEENGHMEQRGLSTHDDYYRQLKDDTANAMKHLCGFRLEPTCRDGVRECVMMALGISLEEAETLFNAIEWLHSYHEIKEHN
jgi:hypothetical protein